MIILEKELSWYISRLQSNQTFSFAGYSDAEWLAMEQTHHGDHTALGQTWTPWIGEQLLKTLREPKGPDYLHAAPKCIEQGNVFGTERIEKIMAGIGREIEWYERDMVTDDLAAAGGLNPLIKQLREMDVVFVGHDAMANLDFLHTKKFVPISTPNFHMERYGIPWVERELLEYGKPGVYIFAAGMSAAVLIHRLHGKIPGAFLLDLGSMWDTFVGTGAQRGWRFKLYNDPKIYKEWLDKCLAGVDDAKYAYQWQTKK